MRTSICPVMAWWMMACFCSSSSVISFCCRADVAPDAPVGVVEEAGRWRLASMNSVGFPDARHVFEVATT